MKNKKGFWALFKEIFFRKDLFEDQKEVFSPYCYFSFALIPIVSLLPSISKVLGFKVDAYILLIMFIISIVHAAIVSRFLKKTVPDKNQRIMIRSARIAINILVVALLVSIILELCLGLLQ